jgi:soluble lytic murein transglycosylase
MNAAFVLVVLLGAGKSTAPEPAAAVAAFHNSPAQSALALARAAEAHPEVAPALNLLQAEAQLAAGARDKARVLAVQAARAVPAFAPRGYFLAATAAMGDAPPDCKGALQLLEKAPVTPHWVPAAERLELLWRAQTACKDAAADKTRRELALDWPDAPVARRASEGLVLTPEQRLRRAEALEKARNYTAAERELSALLASPLADEARFRIGRLHLERLRDDFRAAERAFAQVAAGKSPRAVEAAYLQARALGRAGDAAAAAAAYDAFLTQHPTAPQAADARFFRAFLDYENGRHAAAAVAFGAITEGTWAAPARWYRAFSLHLAGAPEAPAALDAIAAENTDPATTRRARYWAARARETTAPKEARQRLLTLAQEDPTDWYALLVRRRFPGALPDVAALPKGGAGRANVPTPKKFKAVAAQVRALAHAGLPEFARRVLADAWPVLRKSDDWPFLADLARTAEDYGRLYRGAHARHRLIFDRPPRAADAAVWRDAYPLGWRGALERSAPEGLRPTHLAAFIFKESGFDPDAVSPAHAVGLMQLMDYTARNILAARGEEDRPVPDLFEPAENIALGGWYLGALARRFGGQLPLVAAAYNAGPPSVLSWFRGRASVPADLFVENIPFRETRDYVKKLIELHVIFQLVHEGRTLEAAASSLPETLDLTVREGVNF